MRPARDTAWNHNIHYHPVLLAALPERCERALDVGAGDGVFASELRRRVRHVTAIDRDAASIERARRRDPTVECVVGDFLTHDFVPGSFDFVACLAALHHMDAAAALERMRALLRPGGALAVLGLARSRWPADLPRDVVATLVNRAHLLTRQGWESAAPTVWPPAHTYAEIRLLAEDVLGPAVRLRRHLLWRWSLVWTRPLGSEPGCGYRRGQGARVR